MMEVDVVEEELGDGLATRNFLMILNLLLKLSCRGASCHQHCSWVCDKSTTLYVCELMTKDFHLKLLADSRVKLGDCMK
jgi:hypothetical protein